MRAMAEAGGDQAAATSADRGSDTTPKVPRWRRITCGVLVVLVCILAPVSLLAVWTRNTLLNTDQYVDTVGPLAQNSDIQQAIADQVVLQLRENTDIAQRVKDALPAKASFVAPFVAQGIEQFVHTATLKIVESDRFQSLWENLNRKAHGQVIAVLEGNEGGRITTKKGEVALQLGPIVQKVQGALSKIGVDVFSGNEKPRELVLFKSEDLTKIQGLVQLLDDVASWLPFVLVAMLAAAIALSGNRRRTVLRTAIWIAVGMALVLVIFNVGRSFYLDAFRNRDAAAAAYDQVLSFLRLSARTALAVAIIVAIGAWIAGPGRLATRIREGVKGLASGEGRGAGESTAVSRFVVRYRVALRVVVIGLGLLILVILTAPTPLAVLIIALLVLAALIIIEVLGRGGSGAPAPEVAPAPAKAVKAKSTAAKRSD
jgi:hypothetical protein